jgi:AAHS family 4-hydroxybenzoate transporter-like MFS transporter
MSLTEQKAASAAGSHLDIETLIDRGAWAWRQKRVLLLVGLAILFDGIDNQSLGLAAPAILRDWHITKAMLAPAVAAGQFGMMLGAMIGGALGDRIGRKTALIASVLVFGCATLAQAFTHDVLMLGLLRGIAGFGMGGALPNAAALVSEYTPARHRSIAVSAGIVCTPLGAVFAGLAGAQILPTAGWRMLFILSGAVPLVIAIILALSLLESCRYLLLRHGDGDRLRRALSHAGIAVPAGATLVDHTAQEKRARLSALFAKDYARDTLALWIAFGACLVAIYAAFNWIPTMLADDGFDLKMASNGITAFNLGGVAAAMACAWAIGRLGSRGPMVTLALAGALGGALLLLYPLRPDQPVQQVLLELAALGGCANAVQTTLYALGAHIYPVSIRATGVGAASGFGRIGAITSSYLGAILLTSMGHAGLYGLIALALFVSGLGLIAIRRHAAPVR